MTNQQALLDQEFLVKLFSEKQRELYARVASLNVNELPVEYLEGQITGGSINIDGSSAIRRTCSVSMVCHNININDYYWGLRTKVQLEIGLKNNINSLYPDIIWFSFGIFILTNFNTSLGVNSCTVSLQGKDKMCMLNGDLGGQLFASIDFGKEEIVEKTMKQVFPTDASSDTIMSHNYYFKPTSAANQIAESNPLYLFRRDDTYGMYYKVGNLYTKTTSSQNKIRYQIYQKVTTPSDLFKTYSYTYIEGKSYYEKNSNYYVLDTGAVAGRKYYRLKELYEFDVIYTIYEKPLEGLIREAVHTYAKEPYHNIIINDLDQYGLEQLTYKGDVPIYAIRDNQTEHFVQLVFSNSTTNSIVQTINNNPNFKFDKLTAEISTPDKGTVITVNNKQYRVAKIEFGDDIGYRLTDLTYNGDLICSIGESLTSVLDKIKQMLSDFEYFYDIDGRFVFQRKKTYVNTAWSQLKYNNDEYYSDYVFGEEKCTFNFEGNILLTAIQNTPVLNNVKNDYTVWGKRYGVTGAELPIHARYAIDKKPTEYLAFDDTLYISLDSTNTYHIGYPSNKIKKVDWREIIYQMAMDYFHGQDSDEVPLYKANGTLLINTPDDFLPAVAARNPQYPTGYTGYEQYYTDMEGFWRTLYNPDYIPEARYSNGQYEITPVKLDTSNFYTREKHWKPGQINEIIIQYYITQSQLDQLGTNYSSDLLNDQRQYIVTSDSEFLYWNKNVFEAPESLDFWIEFLDSGEELQQFAVSKIGDRAKVVNDDKATSIIFKEIPSLIMYDTYTENPQEKVKLNENLRNSIIEKGGYKFIYIPKGFSQLLTLSYRGKSIKDEIDSLLYQHSYCNENITLTSLPVYSIQPNTLIYVNDEKTQINGEYIVSKISFSLTYNGTMSITATKAPQRIY